MPRLQRIQQILLPAQRVPGGLHVVDQGADGAGGRELQSQTRC